MEKSLLNVPKKHLNASKSCTTIRCLLFFLNLILTLVVLAVHNKSFRAKNISKAYLFPSMSWLPYHEEEVGEEGEGGPHPHAVELHQDGDQQEPGENSAFHGSWISLLPQLPLKGKDRGIDCGNFYTQKYFIVGDV